MGALHLAIPVETEFAQIYVLMDETYRALRARLKMDPRPIPG